ncbi:MAG: hypothetical protein ACTSQU_01160 [Promethearchaeota archaeon]
MSIIIMIEYCIQKEKNWSVVDTIVSEITPKPVAIDNKNEKRTLPMYGIVSLMFVLIGILVVYLNFSSLTISLATPILLVSVITAGAGIEADVVRGTSIIGLIFGIVFLLISLSPVILYVAGISAY